MTNDERREENEAIGREWHKVPRDTRGHELEIGDTVVYAVAGRGSSAPKVKVGVLRKAKQSPHKFGYSNWYLTIESEDGKLSSGVLGKTVRVDSLAYDAIELDYIPMEAVTE